MSNLTHFFAHMYGRWIALMALVACPSMAAAQLQQRNLNAPPSPEPQLRAAYEFLEPYGIHNFSDFYIEALSTLLTAEYHFEKKNYKTAQEVLSNLWSSYPTGDSRWSFLPSQPFGINLGTPPNYYALRMLSDTVDWHMKNPKFKSASRTARMTVILPGQSSGIQPRSIEELEQGTGVEVLNTLEPLLLENDSAVIHDSLRLFREYVVAITEGDLEVEVQILYLPDLDLSVAASVGAGRYYATITDMNEVWNAIDPQVKADTDWWWLMYPSHVPEQYPDFANAEFITGGMGSDPLTGGPLFIADDRWLVRKPPHLGDGAYTEIERRVYSPQWLQHEFFHHLFRIYPEFGLEESSHQWFDRSTWPADFEGRYEPDYYHEAVYKRFLGADQRLVSKLRYASSGAPVTLAEVGGVYSRLPNENGWHVGSILISPELEWLNFANVRWSLADDLENSQLLTGPDCPYFGTYGGNQFTIVRERDELGDLLEAVDGFIFNGEFYKRIAP